MTDTKKELGRSRSANQVRVLDAATRSRRQKRQLEALEKDNFQEDPHAAFAHLAKTVKLPSFNDGTESKKRKKTRSNADHFKQRFRKTFTTLLEELPPDTKPSYVTAQAPPSQLPARHFCSVCGFPSNYTCITCGTRYCCVKCLETHRDTRCLKWTA
ncbi:zinc finger HIT domain-containing protein 1-like isoform X2 [Dysidea avara]|uniref:zinc finger HIT domain-containing protein 1-like isoform X2 n=1 Tax=Dysidea avara TaxID=196820 RepID=UPI0033187F33